MKRIGCLLLIVLLAIMLVATILESRREDRERAAAYGKQSATVEVLLDSIATAHSASRDWPERLNYSGFTGSVDDYNRVLLGSKILVHGEVISVEKINEHEYELCISPLLSDRYAADLLFLMVQSSDGLLKFCVRSSRTTYDEAPRIRFENPPVHAIVAVVSVTSVTRLSKMSDMRNSAIARGHCDSIIMLSSEAVEVFNELRAIMRNRTKGEASKVR